MAQNLSGKKIGIFGGSFDPIHQGHLAIAERAMAEYALDAVWFMPSGHAPHKNEGAMTPAAQRAEMTERAIAPYPGFCLSRLEVEAEETSYTYRTLSKLKEQYPDTAFYFIMGADSLDYFEQWVHPEVICEKATLLVAARDEMDEKKIEQKSAYIRTLLCPACIEPIHGGCMDVSSTRLRRELAEGVHPQMLPDAAWDYIREHGLYGCGGTK